LKEYFKKHYINIRGKRTPKKILIIESDDWGSIRIPNKMFQKKLFSLGLIQEKDPFSKFDCLESADDYKALYAVLCQFEDKRGRHPAFTANMVMGNPDFDKIKSSDFQEFYWEPFYKTYQTYYPEQATFETLKIGISEGFLYPQFHAREHLNALQWLKRLKNRDKQFLKAFALKCFAIDDKKTSNQRANLMATYDYQSEDELAYIEYSIGHGLAFFNETFGFDSATTIAPCYIWNDRIEQIFNKYQVQGIQSSYVQQYNEDSDKTHKRIWQKSGALNAIGQRYWLRNVLFEPALDTSVDWVNKAMESITIAFLWQKPAIIGTHRVNYVAGLSEHNRANSLNQLQKLLDAILKKWPNIIFMNSAELNEYYKRG
jgi:hypothetical protein